MSDCPGYALSRNMYDKLTQCDILIQQLKCKRASCQIHTISDVRKINYEALKNNSVNVLLNSRGLANHLIVI
jgi:5S rRNA maturation endonuclease (ribonuclease M5)